MQVAVDARLARVRAGSFCDFESVGGGDKSGQARDIRRAQQLWQQFKKHASEKLRR